MKTAVIQVAEPVKTGEVQVAYTVTTEDPAQAYLIKCKECSLRKISEYELKEDKREETLKPKAKNILPGSLIVCPECDTKYTGWISPTNHRNKVHSFKVV